MDKISIANECQHMEIVNKHVVLMQTLPLRRFDYKICLLIMAIFGVILSNAIERAYVIANKNKFHGL